MDPGETSPVATAIRELREETGYELEPGAELVSLGHYFTSPGLTDEHCYFFLARPVRKRAGGAEHDATEAIVDCREFGPECGGSEAGRIDEMKFTGELTEFIEERRWEKLCLLIGSQDRNERRDWWHRSRA